MERSRLVIAAVLSLTSLFHGCHCNPYVDYYPPTGLRVVISAPHGGSSKPSSIPDRTDGCWNPTLSECDWSHGCGTTDSSNCGAATVNDAYTKTLAVGLRTAMCGLYGVCPGLVTNLLHRSKLDANREVEEAAMGIPDAVDAWDAYMDALEDAGNQTGGFALYLDIHGHGHPNDWAELGYLVYGSKLDSGNFDESDSSIRNLAASSSMTFTQLLRGNASFGALLEAEGFESVPSPTNPGPDGESYYSGGYITKRFGSRDGGPTDAIQIESPKVFRKSPTRADYVDAIAAAVGDYLTAHGQSLTY